MFYHLLTILILPTPINPSQDDAELDPARHQLVHKLSAFIIEKNQVGNNEKYTSETYQDSRP